MIPQWPIVSRQICRRFSIEIIWMPLIQGIIYPSILLRAHQSIDLTVWIEGLIRLLIHGVRSVVWDKFWRAQVWLLILYAWRQVIKGRATYEIWGRQVLGTGSNVVW